MRTQMTCAQCRELMPRYRAQQLAVVERDAVARHLAGCAACRAELAFWSAVAEALAAVDDTQRLPVNHAQVWHNVHAALAREQGARALQQHAGDHKMTSQTPTPLPTPSTTPTRNADMLPTSSRRHPIAALAAVALIVVLSITLFGVVAPHLHQGAVGTGRGPQPTATPATCAPSHLRQRLPANAELSAISMVSARDGWAVGQIVDLHHPATPPQALIMRFQNCQWQQAGQTMRAATLSSVAMASSTDGWATGTIMTSVNSGAGTEWVDDGGLLLHYHNGAWQSVAFPDSHVPSGGGQIRMASPTNGWMLVFEGKVHTTPYTSVMNYSLYHYDGVRWSAQPMPFKTPALEIADFAAGPDELWIVGSDFEGYGCCGIIARYHGGRWHTWSNVISTSGLDTFDSVALSSPRDVWVFGTHRVVKESSHRTAVVLHFDGTSWSRVPFADSLDGSLGVATAVPSGDVWSVVASGPVVTHNGVVISGTPNVATVIHCVATSCQATSSTLPGVYPVVYEVRALTMFSATQGFAISRLLVFGQGDNISESTTLLYFDGSQWSAIPSAG